jgi:hypothetical protein
VPHRDFIDTQGERWEVFDVRPRQGSEARAVRPELSDGWLTFESRTEKRRLAPIPTDWEDLPTETLADLCEKAVFVRERGDSGNFPRFPG